jgi:hypothetical protein
MVLTGWVMAMNDQRRPLGPVDTLSRTLGCRHSNPDTCRNNATPNRCAFVRDDEICLMPPLSWKRIYRELGGVEPTGLVSKQAVGKRRSHRRTSGRTG